MSARQDTNVPSPSFFERGNVKNVLEHCYVSTLLCISISFFVVFLLLQFQFLTIVLLTTVSSNRRAGYTPIVSGWRSKRQFRTTYLTAMSVCSGKRWLCNLTLLLKLIKAELQKRTPGGRSCTSFHFSKSTFFLCLRRRYAVVVFLPPAFMFYFAFFLSCAYLTFEPSRILLCLVWLSFYFLSFASSLTATGSSATLCLNIWRAVCNFVVIVVFPLSSMITSYVRLRLSFWSEIFICTFWYLINILRSVSSLSISIWILFEYAVTSAMSHSWLINRPPSGIHQCILGDGRHAVCLPSPLRKQVFLMWWKMLLPLPEDKANVSN